MLLTPNSVSSPILRAVRIQRNILCNDFPSPDPALVNGRLADTTSITHEKYANRDLVAQVTSPVNCQACHGQINPIGFTLEHFSPLGAPRQTESIFGPNGIIANHPIDTNVSDLKISGQRAIASTGSADTVNAIAASDEAKFCFSKVMIMNTRYRAVNDTDNCLVNEMIGAQRTGQSLNDVLVNNVANEEIFYKTTAGLQ
jgi:hypothetical protein